MEILEKWKRAARALKAETYALVLAYKDPRTPWYAKVVAGLVFAYALSPIDLVPDFVPVLGYLDDLVLVPLGITLALKLIPADVMAECRAQAQSSPWEQKRVSWLSGLVILTIWVLLGSMAVVLLVGLIR